MSFVAQRLLSEGIRLGLSSDRPPGLFAMLVILDIDGSVCVPLGVLVGTDKDVLAVPLSCGGNGRLKLRAEAIRQLSDGPLSKSMAVFLSL